MDTSKRTETLPAEMLEGCLRADQKSQEMLYKHFFGYCMAICLRYTQSRDEALEVLNDGFLKVFKNLDKYNSTKSFKAWLKRIIVNTAIDHYRSSKKHYFHYDIEEAHHLRHPQENADSALHYQDMLEIIKKLPTGFQLTFNLYVFEGFSHKEIAEMLGISEGTSKSNLSRAREMLRGLLQREVIKEVRNGRE